MEHVSLNIDRLLDGLGFLLLPPLPDTPSFVDRCRVWDSLFLRWAVHLLRNVSLVSISGVQWVLSS